MSKIVEVVAKRDLARNSWDGYDVVVDGVVVANKPTCELAAALRDYVASAPTELAVEDVVGMWGPGRTDYGCPDDIKDETMTARTFYYITREGHWIGNVAHSEAAAAKFCRRFSGTTHGRLSYTTEKPPKRLPGTDCLADIPWENGDRSGVDTCRRARGHVGPHSSHGDIEV